MIWDVDSYVIYEPGPLPLPSERQRDAIDMESTLEYRRQVQAIYQEMMAKNYARWKERQARNGAKS